MTSRPRKTLGVRTRITAVATLIAGAAVAVTAVVVLYAVETSLEAGLHDEERAAIERVREALGDGATVSELDLASLFDRLGSAPAIQVLDENGHVVATSGATDTLRAGAIGGAVELEPPSTGATPQGEDSADTTLHMQVRPMVEVDGSSADVSVTKGQVELTDGAFTVLAASPLAPVRASLAAVERGLAVALPLLVAIVALTTWFLTGRALRPVEEICSEVETISATTLSRRVPEPGTSDEIGRLAATMNRMLDRLESAATKQQRFVADASHELRSPVATIRAHLEVARHTSDSTDWSAVVDDVLAEEARLEATIADLLLSASMEEGAPANDHEPVDLAAVADDIGRRPRTERVELRITAPGPALVHGSPVQLDRALSNLVDNAVRHATTSVAVSVSAPNSKATGAATVQVIVDDDGPGIDPADRSRVFERFTRLDDHRKRSDDTAGGGTGLGLALVRQIAHRHGGTIAISSAPSGGARFVLELPVDRSGLPDRTVGIAPDQVGRTD